VKVRVHPHITKVRSGEEQCISITPTGGKAYYKGSVILEDVFFMIYTGGLERARKEQVRNVHAWIVGELAGTHDSQIPLDEQFLVRAMQVSYHYNEGKFIAKETGTDVTEYRFDFGYLCGKDLHVWNE
jgi:hypothetical protein